MKTPHKEHDKEVSKCLSGSVHLIRTNKYWPPQNVWGARKQNQTSKRHRPCPPERPHSEEKTKKAGELSLGGKANVLPVEDAVSFSQWKWA